MRVTAIELLVVSLSSFRLALTLPSADVLKRESESTGTLEVVQAQVPPRLNYNNPSCTQTIFNHLFASSYGIPYVGE